MLTSAAMNLELIEETLRLVRAAKEDELGKILLDVGVCAEQRGLMVLPGEIEGPRVVLDSSEMTAQDVVDAAQALNAKALYVSSASFDSDAFPKMDLNDVAPEIRKALFALRREFERVDGWIEDMSVSFAHAGVLHTWQAHGPSLLPTQWDSIYDDDADVLEGPRWGPPLGDAEVDELATKLAAYPDFRDARTPNARVQVAKTMPELAKFSERPGQAGVVSMRAQEILREAGESWAERLQEHLPQLAGELAGLQEFRTAATAEARKRVTAKWILQHTEGAPVAAWWTDELAAKAHRAKKDGALQPIF